MSICQRAREWYAAQINRLWERKERWERTRRVVDLYGNEHRPTEVPPELLDQLRERGTK